MKFSFAVNISLSPKFHYGCKLYLIDLNEGGLGAR